MNRCPKCGELNSDSRRTCYRCAAEIPIGYSAEGVQCIECGKRNLKGNLTCIKCGARLPVNSVKPELQKSADSGSPGCLFSGFSFLIPILGIIFAIIFLSKDEKENAKTLLKFALAGIVVSAMLGWFVSCATSLINS